MPARRARGRRRRELQRELVAVSRQAATRRQRQLFTSVSAALAVSIALTIFALAQRSNAIDQRNTALARELGAQAQRNYDSDPELSVLLAAEGVRAKGGTESEDVLRTALVRSRVRARDDVGSPVVSVAIAPRDELYVASTFGRRAYVYELDSGRRLASFSTHTYGAAAVWDPKGGRLAVGGSDGIARVFEPRTGATVAQLRTGHDAATSVAWSPDAKLLAVGAVDTAGEDVATRQTGGVAQVWDVASQRLVATLRGHVRGVNALAWTADGRLLVTVGADPRVRVWNARTWTLRGTLAHARDDHVVAVLAPAFGTDYVVTSASIRGDVGELRVQPSDADRVGTRLWNAAHRLTRARVQKLDRPGGDRRAGHPARVRRARQRDRGLRRRGAQATARAHRP